MKIHFLKLFLQFSLLLVFVVQDTHSAYYSEQPRWNESLNYKDIEGRLEKSLVSSSVPMAHHLAQKDKKIDFDNEVYFVVLANGLKAVFKPGDSRFAEVAAYRASRFLSQHLVPPTVFRIIDGQEGSLQLYIDTSYDLLKDPSSFFLVPQKTRLLMNMFYFVFGQWDCGYGNRIIQKNDERVYLALIDNAGMANRVHVRYGEHPFVCLGWNDDAHSNTSASFPFDEVVCIKDFTLDEAKNLFGGFLSEESLLRLWQRYKKYLRYIIWQQALWVQMHLDSTSKATQFPPEVLVVYKKLSKPLLMKIWREARMTQSQRKYEQLILLTLERRDQLLSLGNQ